MKKDYYPKWLDSAIFYQIYPQSFHDSNGDGIGDLPGIIKKLDYVKSLGCNAIWINPCFESPFYDAGYDVSDYYNVAPRYGNNADMKRLFRVAHKKGIRVCLDLVPGHTSVEHLWFKESCKAKMNKYSNRYVWTDSPWAGMLSNDWGLKSINGYSQRHGAYITNFFWSQPALNFGFAKPDPGEPWQLPINHPDCLQTREAIKNIMRYWLDMGADGFRVDVAGSLVKGDPDKKATVKLWKDIISTLNKNYPDAALVSEWFAPDVAIKGGFHVDFANAIGNDSITAIFRAEKNANIHHFWTNVEKKNSYFNKQAKGDVFAFIKEFQRQRKKIGNHGRIGLFTGNHDLPRISFNRNQKEVELIFVFILTMPAVPFIYYGDEIAMRYQHQLHSKEGGYDRTGSRTPMQWNNSKNAGFSSAASKQLYLPIDANYKKLNVQLQQDNPNSLLNKVSTLTALRNQNPALWASAKLEPVFCQPNKYPLIYQRSTSKQKVLIIINPSATSTKTSVELFNAKKIERKLLGSGVRTEPCKDKFIIHTQGISYGVFEVK